MSENNGAFSRAIEQKLKALKSQKKKELKRVAAEMGVSVKYLKKRFKNE